jgi:hypothetical protein
MVGVAGDFFSKWDEHWWKTILGWLLLSAAMMLLYVIVAYYSLFYQFRQTEREVRKLIYQDILFQLKREEKEWR